MIITAHPPNYLPWIGLFHKICLADQYVIYDDVELSHYGFSNCTSIAGKDGINNADCPNSQGIREKYTYSEHSYR